MTVNRHFDPSTEKTGNTHGSDGADWVLLHDTASVYRTNIDPLLSTVPTAEFTVDGVGTASFVPQMIRVVVNPFDTIAAADALAAGRPDVFWLGLDDFLEIRSDVAITRICLIAVDFTAAAPANYTGNDYIVPLAEADASDWQAEMLTLDFDSSADVRAVILQTSAVYSTNFCKIKVTGVSHA